MCIDNSFNYRFLVPRLLDDKIVTMKNEKNISKNQQMMSIPKRIKPSKNAKRFRQLHYVPSKIMHRERKRESHEENH